MALMQRFLIMMIGLIVLLGLSPVSGQAPVNSVDGQLKPNVEQLFLNYKQLQKIHKDLHEITITSFQGPEMESSYIRQANLFISEATLMCWNQWELLSITHFIKEDHKVDFYTLRFRDLQSVITESNHRIQLLKLYSGYIGNKNALASIDAAIGIIEGNIYLFESLSGLLQPLARSPNAFNQRLP
jgi:hypothetical protein